MGFVPLTPAELVVGLTITTIAATLQGTIGFGFAVVSVPILALVNPLLAPVPQLLVVLPLTVSMAYRERGAIDLKGFKWVLAGRLLGTGCGIACLALAPKVVLDIVLATIVLGAVGALTTIAQVPRNPWTESIAGTFSGISAMVSAIGGPPLALLYRDAGGGTLRASLAALFSIGLVITIGTRALGGFIVKDDIIVAGCLLPAVLMGLLLSRFFMGRVEGAPLKTAISVVASLAALGLLARALSNV
ncbi:MAG: sulfite exporter TauE/SafE family protein [Myxococcota bacterium]|nr:sulfite exporter TauE/SafE family protein [Myxococcota bacterium]